MFPEAVHHAAAEIFVGGIGHPRDEARARIGAGREIHRRAVERLRDHHFLRARLGDAEAGEALAFELLAGLGEFLFFVGDFLLRVLGVLAGFAVRVGLGGGHGFFLLGDPFELLLFFLRAGAEHGAAGERAFALERDAREERGEVIEIILRVALERMIVAAGATDACAEKGLRHRVGQLGIDVPFFADGGDEVADLRCVHGVAGGGEEVAREFVPRAVDGDLRAQPRVKRAHALRAAHVVVALPAILEEVAELQRPEIHELGTLEQRLDEARAFVGIFVGEERANFLGRGQRADGVEGGAAQKRGVVRELRGRDAQCGELVEDVLIEGVVAAREGLGRDFIGERQRDGHDLDLFLKMHAHRGLALAFALDDSLGRHARDGLVVRVKLREPRHVAHTAIGVMRAHEQALTVAEAERVIAGQNLKARGVGFAGGGSGRTRANPLGERAVITRVRGETLAAFVRNAREGFEQQQAGVGRGGIDAPTAGFARERLVIPLGSKAAQGKFEAVLSRKFSVAPAGIAAAAREGGDDFLTERRGLRGGILRGNLRGAYGRDGFEVGEGGGDFGAEICG